MSLKARLILLSAALLLAALFVTLALPPLRILNAYGTQERFEWRGDAFWKLQFLREFAQSDTPGFAFVQHDPHPKLGWIPKPGLRAGVQVESTNEAGYRGTQPATLREDAFRVLALGDSFTFGQGVPDGRDWPARLEALDPRLQVFNLGVCGYGVDQMYLRLQEAFATCRPHLVLFAPTSLDFDRTLLRFREYAKPRFVVQPDDTLLLTNVPVPPMEEVLRTLHHAYGTWRVRDLLEPEDAAFRESIADGSYDAEWSRLNQRILEEAALHVRGQGAALLFVHLAAHFEIAKQGYPADKPLPTEALMQAAADKSGAPFLATRRAFLEAPGTWTEGHYTAVECAFVAELIFEKIKSLPVWPSP